MIMKGTSFWTWPIVLQFSQECSGSLRLWIKRQTLPDLLLQKALTVAESRIVAERQVFVQFLVQTFAEELLAFVPP
jgi:hypothetical protein